MTVTDASFTADVERSPLPVLIDAWAPWCGPCRTIAPVIEELASELAGRIRVAKLNVDENPMTAARFNARSIPTLLALKAGREVDRIAAAQPKSEIARRLERATAWFYHSYIERRLARSQAARTQRFSEEVKHANERDSTRTMDQIL